MPQGEPIAAPPDGLPDPHDDLLEPREILRNFLGVVVTAGLVLGWGVTLSVVLVRVLAQAPTMRTITDLGAALCLPVLACASLLSFTRFWESPRGLSWTVGALAVGALLGIGVAAMLDHSSAAVSKALVLSTAISGLLTLRMRVRGPLPFDAGYGLALGIVTYVLIS
jgi:hypothetical protein